MTKEEVGKLIYFLRQKKNIKIEKLSRGICSKNSVTRLERGERFPDYFVMERILARLGKSVNKLEFLPDEQVYEIYYLREVIEKYLEEGEYESAAKGLAYYGKRKEAQEPIHKQYIDKIKAVLEKKDASGSIPYLEQAIGLTLPGFQIEKIEEYALGEEEVILLLIWLDEKNKQGEIDVLEHRDRILNYIRCTFSDEEVLANIYAKAAWIFMKEFMVRGKMIEAASIGNHTIDILIQNGLLLNLPQFLELLLVCYKEVSPEQYKDWKKQRDALKWVYDKYGKRYEMEEINLWKNYHQNEIYLLSEVVAQERKLLKKSQEKVADELDMDQKTISRIETGKYRPKRGTFQKLKNYMNIDREICSTSLVVDNYELLELERDISREMYFGRYNKAEQLFIELKEQLSMEQNENRQFVRYMDVIFSKENNRITEETAIKGCKEALGITRKNCEIEDLEEVVLNRNEVAIVNYISKMYYRLGEREKAIDILEAIARGFENSKVDIRYHYVSAGLIYENLSRRYEENNEYDKAIAFCKKGIELELRCERGNVVGRHIMQKAYTEERKTGDKKACQYDYQQAYQLLKLMRVKSSMEALGQYYRNDYGDDIS